MRNKILILTLILLVSIVAAQIVNAVSAAPSSICEITANVLKVEKTRTNIAGKGIPPREDFDYYRVNLDILDISTYKQEGGRSCDNSYIELAEKYGQILTLTEYDKNPISEGQKIKAKIHFGGDEWFGGYFLSDIQTLEETTANENMQETGNENKQKTGLNYWYYIAPFIIIFVVIIFYILFKNKKK